MLVSWPIPELRFWLFGGLDPERPQLERDGIERTRADARVAVVLLDLLEVSGFECQHLERSPQRIDEPGVRDALSSVNAELLAAIDGFGGRRYHFANPIRREGQVRVVGQRRETFTAPTRDVGNEHVVA